ncbi:MAG: helix-turn-helix domain-containing protein [Rikenellaceae bacterium]
MEARERRLDIQINRGKRLLGQNMFIASTTIFRCTEGSATLLLNGEICSFGADTNFIIIDSAHLCVEQCSEDFCFTTIVFEGKAFNRLYTHIDISVLDALKQSTPDMVDVEGFVESNLTIDKICLLNGSQNEYKSMIMRNLIFCYIYEVYNVVSRSERRRQPQNSSYVDSLVSRFIVLCRDNHASHRDIAFYSDALSISRRYLHTIVVEKTQSTPKQIIDGYVITSAKKLLMTTTKSNMQIAEELNFPDLSSFDQFFKRIIKLSPTEFVKQHR